MTSLHRAVRTILEKISSHWSDVDWLSLTDADRDAYQRMIWAGFAEARYTAHYSTAEERRSFGLRVRGPQWWPKAYATLCASLPPSWVKNCEPADHVEGHSDSINQIRLTAAGVDAAESPESFAEAIVDGITAFESEATIERRTVESVTPSSRVISPFKESAPKVPATKRAQPMKKGATPAQVAAVDAAVKAIGRVAEPTSVGAWLIDKGLSMRRSTMLALLRELSRVNRIDWKPKNSRKVKR